MDADMQWTPYLERMKELIDPLRPDPIREWQGTSLAPAREFSRGRAQGGFGAWRADKLEKIGIGSFVHAGNRHFASVPSSPGKPTACPFSSRGWRRDRTRSSCWWISFPWWTV